MFLKTLAGWAILASVANATYPVIDTAQGKVRGTASEYRSNVTPPTSPKSHDGVLNATKHGPQCKQESSGSAGIFYTGSEQMSEDCLYLNIWTPTYDNGEELKSKNLPVYYWIYGSRYEMGPGDVKTYDGSGLAIKDIIVVTVNYRVGAFGYFAHPELSAESAHNSSGNYGSLDQIAGLKWVHENIANFGGNPNQIVTGGQSAGSASSLIMAYSPLSRDYVAGAISESGALSPHDPNTASIAVSYRDKTEAEDFGLKLSKQLNITTPAQLRNLSAEVLNSLDSENEDLLAGTQFVNLDMEPPEWRPVIDGWVLKQKYGQLLCDNDHADVPIMTGFNKDEGISDYNATYYKSLYGEVFQNFSTEFFKLYPADNDTQATDSFNIWKRDMSRVTSLKYATDWVAGGAGTNVYTYFFTRASQEDHSGGAYHGAELWYTFNNIPYADYTANLTWPAKDYAIADRMSDYWVNFIKSGNPNGEGLPKWEPSTQEAKKITYLGNTWGMRSIAPDAVIDFLMDWFSTLVEW
ncbi:alpha/beta-hydrolase [Penicillium longicatenatum]|uniref:alpha/beta-hydrolase n=1 Tax=Penicillium longicatenatum TaxID=1561947 RepID=UPI0025467DF1|nr:alpha/beta-hydrolase [Penicillium longicatenatum]KAJ5649648.1 alpha/beta-hydrolase [Penicillium longicatenatum]